ncbi:MAG: hypothetical protein ACI9H8_002038 [Lysobacterales bacterium]|jgi:uncharacterized protein
MNQSLEQMAATIDEPYVGPVQGKERFSSIDVVRGVALFGILLINIIWFGHGMGAIEFTTGEGAVGANFWAWVVEYTFFEGTQRLLFSLLFGAGVIILTSRAEERGGGIKVADIYYRRNLWLFAFGMIDSYLLLWEGDILYYYGLAALFLFPLRNMKAKHLLLAGLACLSILVAERQYDANQTREQHSDYAEAQAVLATGAELDEEQQEAFDGWEKELKGAKFNADEHEEMLEAMTTSYWTAFMHNVPFLTRMHGYVTYRFIFLDVLSIMLIGMALLKMGVLTLQKPTRFYYLLMLAGYGIGLPVSIWEVNHVVSNDFALLSLVDISWSYDLGRLAMGTGHLALLLLFVNSGIMMWLQDRLAAVGRMALTNYIFHSVICAIIFKGVGFGLFGYFERYELYYVVAIICLFQLLISKIWLDKYRFGPLEWLWRSLTYLKNQPMKR